MIPPGARCEICRSLLDEEDLFCANCGTEAPHQTDHAPVATRMATHNFECRGCGASMSYDASAGTLRCPFCGSTQLDSRDDVRVIAPSRVLPFAIEREEAVARMRSWLGRGFWRPGDLSERAIVVQMTPVYVPFWIFRATAHTYWTADSDELPAGAAGDWQPLAGEHRGRYEQMLVGASGVLTQRETDQIGPYRFEAGVAPEEVDLENVTVEQFSVMRKYARPVARRRLEQLEAEACRRQYVPGRCRNVQINALVEGMQSEPLLVPVWIMAYRYRDDVFRFLVNGQSGQATGRAPTSRAKIAGVVAVAIVGALIVLLLLARGSAGRRERRLPLPPERPPAREWKIGAADTPPPPRRDADPPTLRLPDPPPPSLASRDRGGSAIVSGAAVDTRSVALLALSPAVHTMSRETVLSGDDPLPDAPLTGDARAAAETPNEDDRLLRPQRMEEMVGQREVYERVWIAVDAARKRGTTLGHMLFDGPPGLGKTTFAMCIPREMGVGLQIASGAALAAPKDLLPYLTNAEENSVLFIDEIHRLPKTVEEFLYPAMEDFRVDITLGEGISARTINMSLRPFTLIGATTRTGLISPPMRDRFQIREHLDFYSEAELAEIVHRNAGKLDVAIDDTSASEIARRSRGTPRVANNRLRWVHDYVTSRADGAIHEPLTRAALEMLGIDALGLDPQDRKYMQTILRIFQGGPVGVEAVAHTLNLAPDTLIDEVEPYLLRSGLVIRTPRGRRLTERGFAHLGVNPADLTDAEDDETPDDQPRLF